MGLVTPGIGLIFWMTLSFLVLLFLLKKFAWKPIIKMIEDREQSIDEALHAADKAREEMKSLQSDHEILLIQAKNDRDGILAEAHKIKGKILDEAKDKANEEYHRIIESAKERIEFEKQSAIVKLKQEVAEISIEIAELILNAELKDKEAHQQVIKKQLKEVEFN